MSAPDTPPLSVLDREILKLATNPSMCRDLGTVPNQSPTTVAHALECTMTGEVFTCHTDSKPCRGWMQSRYAGSKRHVDDRALPQDLWQLLIQARYALTIDAAAAAHNAKLDRYWTEEDNALEKSWAGERIYCNPPYSDIGPWVRKAWSETNAEIIVMLLPANRTEQTWWQEEIEPHRDREGSPLRTEFLPGRLRFLKPGQQIIGANERPPFGCVLCVWNYLPFKAPIHHP